MGAFDRAIEHLLPIEGGYSNDPSDSGGETKFGITLATARAFGYFGAMRDMSREDAVTIYRARYWAAINLQSIEGMSEAIALELFDTAVNRGPGVAGTYLQRALNVLNQGGALYQDISTDGAVGPVTIAALREYLQRRGREGELVMLHALNCLQGTDYIELAEARPKDERFVYGWLLKRVTL